MTTLSADLTIRAMSNATADSGILRLRKTFNLKPKVSSPLRPAL
jgi:hypothetical protein